ncbi:MAG: hypothetical protein KDE50_23105 [Caldilineaceae bacterium]|nr:hypothetical protein [Caldilineaceae bacterium]
MTTHAYHRKKRQQIGNMITAMLTIALLVVACSTPVAPPVTPPEEPTSTNLPPPSITILSDPTGALVELGIQEVNSVVTPGTGRIVGRTPLEAVELRSSDISINQDYNYANLHVWLTLDGYLPLAAGITLGEADAKFEPGDHFEIDVQLESMH